MDIRSSDASVIKPLAPLRPLAQPLVLVCASIGAVVLAGVVALTLLPVMVIGGVLLIWAALTVLLGWAGLEAMAALERWFENDPRFQR